VSNFKVDDIVSIKAEWRSDVPGAQNARYRVVNAELCAVGRILIQLVTDKLAIPPVESVEPRMIELMPTPATHAKVQRAKSGGFFHAVMAGKSVAICGVSEEWDSNPGKLLMLTCPNCRLQATTFDGPMVTLRDPKFWHLKHEIASAAIGMNGWQEIHTYTVESRDRVAATIRRIRERHPDDVARFSIINTGREEVIDGIGAAHMSQQSLPTLDVVVALINRDVAAGGYCLDKAQIECLRDPARRNEARGMIDDIHARITTLAKDTLDSVEAFLGKRSDVPTFSAVMDLYTHARRWEAGGGLTAWRLDYNGGYLLFSEVEAERAPSDEETGSVSARVYPDTADGDCERVDTVKVVQLESWIDAFLDKTAEG
jgi:hypothetical protein